MTSASSATCEREILRKGARGPEKMGDKHAINETRTKGITKEGLDGGGARIRRKRFTYAHGIEPRGGCPKRNGSDRTAEIQGARIPCQRKKHHQGAVQAQRLLCGLHKTKNSRIFNGRTSEVFKKKKRWKPGAEDTQRRQIRGFFSGKEEGNEEELGVRYQGGAQ